MDYVLEPSLQYTALVKVAAILWNQDDVKNLLSEFCNINYTEFKSKKDKMEAIVLKKVTKLPLPKQIKEKISCFIRPVGVQIAQWKQFLVKHGHLTVDFPAEFCWTSQGTIDKKKTAEMMIKNESIDITTRYSLACIHCLEDDIPKLWEKIPKGQRKSFYSTADNYVLPLVEFWTYYITKDMHEMNRMIKEDVGYRMPLFEYAFKSALVGYTVAAEYFLQNLTVWEADLVGTAMDIACGSFFVLADNYADILFLLFSYLDEEEQKRVFECNSFPILTSLLDYPLQHFFMETANYMWNFLEKDDYAYVLNETAFKIKDGYKDFDYQKLLGEFWQKIPIDNKRHVLSQSLLYSTIRDLFETGDEENIRLIFRDATPEEKKRLFYHDSSQDICKTLLNGDNPLSLLKYFIRECLPSKDEVIEFKEHLESSEMGEFQFKFIHVLDEIIDEFKKRKHEEDDNSKSKKVCSLRISDMTQCADK